MECEMKDSCANYDGECTNDMYCLCEDYEEITKEQILWNTLHDTIVKLREYNQEDLIKMVAKHEELEYNLREQISTLTKQIPNIEQLRKECQKEARKEVFGNFTIGQEVFVVESTNSRPTCTECKGTKKIKCTLSTGEEADVSCPKCKGWGTLDDYTYHPKKAIIESMRLSIWRDVKTRQPIIHIKIKLVGYDYETEPEHVYATVEECQAHIDAIKK